MARREENAHVRPPLSPSLPPRCQAWISVLSILPSKRGQKWISVLSILALLLESLNVVQTLNNSLSYVTSHSIIP